MYVCIEGRGSFFIHTCIHIHTYILRVGGSFLGLKSFSECVLGRNYLEMRSLVENLQHKANWWPKKTFCEPAPRNPFRSEWARKCFLCKIFGEKPIKTSKFLTKGWQNVNRKTTKVHKSLGKTLEEIYASSPRLRAWRWGAFLVKTHRLTEYKRSRKSLQKHVNKFWKKKWHLYRLKFNCRKFPNILGIDLLRKGFNQIGPSQKTINSWVRGKFTEISSETSFEQRNKIFILWK